MGIEFSSRRVRAILEACPEWLRPIAGLAVATGMRRGEVLGLRWLDIDFKSGRIRLPQTNLRACRSVNVSDFRFHDLRHTAASWMRMKGADIHTVALILGHKNLRMAAGISTSAQHSFRKL
jgi:integrase